jgi:hypothetical protein
VNPFDILADVQQDYLTYARAFQRFQTPRIQDWVMDRIEHGTLLWKPPFVQLSRPFAPGERLETLVDEGLLHPGVPIPRREGLPSSDRPSQTRPRTTYQRHQRFKRRHEVHASGAHAPGA